MRQRLSWDQEKVAEIAKKADPYTMNQDHKNPPVQKYDIGGPSEFAEDPDMKTPWKTEGRTETGHPAPAREAVKSARQLEDKALKCITIAQRMLPGASDGSIEEQATELMYLPDNCVLATLQRQSKLAETLVPEKEAKKSEDEEDKSEDEEKSAAKAEDDEKKPEEEEKSAAKAEDDEKKPEEEEKSAAKAEDDEKKPEEEEKSAAKAEDDEKKPEEEEKSAAKAEDDEKKPEEEEKSAAEEADLLDSIFANEEKTGAKKLSGIVKQASDGNTGLDNLWNAPPDVSKAFK